MSENSMLFENLAAIQHDIWAHWQGYLQNSKCKPLLNAGGVATGALIIDKEDAEHWQRQINTPYSELSEKEKASDREQVGKFWDLIKAQLPALELGDLMTMRVALTMFIMDLNRTGLGNDETGKGICSGYIARSSRLIPLIAELEDELMG